MARNTDEAKLAERIIELETGIVAFQLRHGENTEGELTS
jgi:hypothetical protein